MECVNYMYMLLFVASVYIGIVGFRYLPVSPQLDGLDWGGKL